MGKETQQAGFDCDYGCLADGQATEEGPAVAIDGGDQRQQRPKDSKEGDGGGGKPAIAHASPVISGDGGHDGDSDGLEAESERQGERAGGRGWIGGG